jgi:tetratricopeptide (TPR) repeat protein
MPKHHYLPATFLANFSLDTEKQPRRKSVIFQGDKKTKEIKEVTAESVGKINNLYTLLDYKKDPETIDKIWKDYEYKLNITIPRLIVGHDLDAKTWIRFLVPFVACMLVRGPDFNIRFENRIKSILGEYYSEEFNNKDNTNGARVLELQRLLFPVAAAKWIVINTQGLEPLLTNDLGYCPFIHPQTIDYGMAIPLNVNHVLAISPRKNGEIIRFYGGKWRPIIHYRAGSFGNHEDLNRSIVSMAQRFVFSPTRELLEKYLPQFQNHPRPIEPEQLGFIDGYHSRAYEFTWHRLAIFLEENINNDESGDGFPLKWDLYINGWNPPVIFPTNLSGFPVPLQRTKQSIILNCYDPDDYYALNIVMNCESVNAYEEMLNNANLGFQNTSNEEMKLEFLFALSIALYELGYINDSYKILSEILTRKPSHHNARLNLAANLLEEKKYDDALVNLKFLLEDDPNSIMARVNLSNYYVLQGDYSKAIEEATKALNQSPKGNLLGCMQLSRGLAFLHDEQLDKAFIDFSSACENVTNKEKLGMSIVARLIPPICGWIFTSMIVLVFTTKTIIY